MDEKEITIRLPEDLIARAEARVAETGYDSLSALIADALRDRLVRDAIAQKNDRRRLSDWQAADFPAHLDTYKQLFETVQRPLAGSTPEVQLKGLAKADGIELTVGEDAYGATYVVELADGRSIMVRIDPQAFAPYTVYMLTPQGDAAPPVKRRMVQTGDVHGVVRVIRSSIERLERKQGEGK
ncbi:ribbon-helix-helix domain-containing protein [Streptosporangium sandarakinum]